MLGWTFRGSKYCQLIRHLNKVKRFVWACDNYVEVLDNRLNCFNDVIWSDETTVQLESHRRHSYRIKLHVWAGISRRGPTPIAIFEGIMDADFYVSILPTPIHP